MDILSTHVVSGVKLNKRIKGKHCSFCCLNTGHFFTCCPKQDKHKTNANVLPFQEYDMNSPASRTMMITIIESSMRFPWHCATAKHQDAYSCKKRKCDVGHHKQGFSWRKLRPSSAKRRIGNLCQSHSSPCD